MIINSYMEDEPEYPVGSPNTGMFDLLKTSGKEKVLEIGCGPGRHAFALADKVEEIFAIDIQDYMIAHANKNYKKDNITCLKADFLELEFPENHYDIIVAQNVFYHIKDKEACLKK